MKSRAVNGKIVVGKRKNLTATSTVFWTRAKATAQSWEGGLKDEERVRIPYECIIWVRDYAFF